MVDLSSSQTVSHNQKIKTIQRAWGIPMTGWKPPISARFCLSSFQGARLNSLALGAVRVFFVRGRGTGWGKPGDCSVKSLAEVASKFTKW